MLMFVVVLFLTVMLLLTIQITFSSALGVSHNRLNYGVIFYAVDEIHVATDDWWHQFVINLPERNISIPTLNELSLNNSNCHVHTYCERHIWMLSPENITPDCSKFTT